MNDSGGEANKWETKNSIKIKETGIMLNGAHTRYLSKLVSENSTDPKSLFKMIDNLLNRKKKSPLPDHSSASELAASFNIYFIDKVTVIHQSLEEGNQTQNISAVVSEESRYQIGLRMAYYFSRPWVA